MSSIIEKLQKLIKHEESAREIGNIAEAAAFAARIQDLLTKHQLSMSDVEIREEVDRAEAVADQIVRPGDVGTKHVSHFVKWQSSLLGGIARANACETLCSTGSNHQFVIGLAADRQKVITLYSYFVKLAEDLCDRAFREWKKSVDYTDVLSWHRASESRTWKRSWLEGFATEIRNRLWTARRDAERETEKHADQTGALIHFRNKDAAAKAFVDKGGYKSRAASRSYTNYDAWGAGREAGRSVSLSGNSLGAERSAIGSAS